jgi:predicted aspartyl protease
MKKKKEQAVKIILEQLDKDGYHLFINLKVNGKKCRCLIDTGASHSVIDKRFYEKNFKKKKLKTVKQSTTGLHSSTAESHFGKIEQLTIGKTIVKNHVAAAIDLSHVNSTYAQIKKPKIQGILGSDILWQYKMIIDYGRMQLIIP